jgi:hypothetical protein
LKISATLLATELEARQHASEPGWFRICYAAVPQAQLLEALQRFSRWLSDLRELARMESSSKSASKEMAV